MYAQLSTFQRHLPRIALEESLPNLTPMTLPDATLRYCHQPAGGTILLTYWWRKVGSSRYHCPTLLCCHALGRSSLQSYTYSPPHPLHHSSCAPCQILCPMKTTQCPATFPPRKQPTFLEPQTCQQKPLTQQGRKTQVARAAHAPLHPRGTGSGLNSTDGVLYNPTGAIPAMTLTITACSGTATYLNRLPSNNTLPAHMRSTPTKKHTTSSSIAADR